MATHSPVADRLGAIGGAEKGGASALGLDQFLPLKIKGISQNDGSISFGPADLKIVLGYITNACSFGDFVSSALAGRRDFGAQDTAVTELQCAKAVVDRLNSWSDLLKVVERVAENFSKTPLATGDEHEADLAWRAKVGRALSKAKGSV